MARFFANSLSGLVTKQPSPHLSLVEIDPGLISAHVKPAIQSPSNVRYRTDR